MLKRKKDINKQTPGAVLEPETFCTEYEIAATDPQADIYKPTNFTAFWLQIMGIQQYKF